MNMARTGRPISVRDVIIARAMAMKISDGRINKSRIARELHVSLRHVRRVIPISSI